MSSKNISETFIDDEVLAVKVSGVHKILKTFCNQNGWGYVDHSNMNMTLTGVVYTSTLKELPDLRQILLIT